MKLKSLAWMFLSFAVLLSHAQGGELQQGSAVNCASLLVPESAWDDLDDDPSPVFRESGIASLTFKGLSAYIEHRNYASLPAERLPPSFLLLIYEVNRTLRSVARVLGLNFARSFGENGVSLNIVVGPLGPIGSDDGAMGVFTDWSPTEGVDPVVYAHELTHVITHHPESHGLPPVLRSLDESFVFNEFIADWVAYKAEGHVDVSIQGVDLTGFHMRGHDLISYDLPSGRFSGQRTQYDILGWIRAIAAKEQPLPREQILLNGVVEMIGGAIPDESSLPPLDPSPLAIGGIRGLDNHQLGMPLFFLFRDLETRLGRDLMPEMMRAFHALDAQSVTDRTYQVFLEGYEERTEDSIHVVIKQPRHFLAHFREQLAEGAERQAFDELLDSRSIMKGLLLEESSYWYNRVARYATDVMRKRFRSNGGQGTGIYNPSNPVYSCDYGIRGGIVLLIRDGAGIVTRVDPLQK